MRNICYTAQLGREHFSCRQAFVASNHQQLLSELEQTLIDPLVETTITKGAVQKVAKLKGPVYLFTGQGSQYVGMAKKLYETENVFKQSVDMRNYNVTTSPVAPQKLLASNRVGFRTSRTSQSSATSEAHDSMFQSLG